MRNSELRDISPLHNISQGNITLHNLIHVKFSFDYFNKSSTNESAPEEMDSKERSV